MAGLDDTIEAVRAFNRDYTRRIGLLDETLTGSGYTLAEARVLFELGAAGRIARDIAADLRLDPAYLARILDRFVRKGLVARSRSEGDGRALNLSLTPAGVTERERLQALSRSQLGAMLGGLAPRSRARLVSAMGEVSSLLDRATAPSAPVIRPHRIGDIGMVISRQAALYAQEHGWDIGFEALLAEIGAGFIRDFRPGRDFCWIAERNDAVAGSVFLVHTDDDSVGKLRMLYVEPSARGLGLGNRLVDTCMAQARAIGCRKLVLWTNDILVSARRIYEAAGFRLVQQGRHHSFGKDLVEQTWELEL
ncbi:MAG: MarR family transcriptional regulator [Rhizobiaceae bacterium]|nr:MarR family transcriptional regulator [Rhizobiaceae bacterium]